MTAKEKAKDLFDMFNSKNDILFHQLDKEGAKQCALIVVDEIYNTNLKFGSYKDTDWDKNYRMTYWIDVKQEIEKL